MHSSSRQPFLNLEQEVAPSREQGEATASKLLMESVSASVERFRHSILGGEPWYIALLEAIGFWPAQEEMFKGQYYRYLIADEAFDWLLLAERLCREVDGLIPARQRYQLLSRGRFPQDISEVEFRGRVGQDRYRAILNFWYGVTVEGALQMSVEREVSKERFSNGIRSRKGVVDQAFLRVYGVSRDPLLSAFQKERGYPRSKVIASHEVKEFTYWLFKLRIAHCEKARIASDTMKGLEFLNRSRVLPFAPGVKRV